MAYLFIRFVVWLASFLRRAFVVYHMARNSASIDAASRIGLGLLCTARL
jgi:hypothetical protein